MKTKLKLTDSDIKALDVLLTMALASVTMDELHEQPHHYLAAACLFEVQDKVGAKAREVRVFGIKKAAITLTRPQALAFDLWFNPGNFEDENDAEIIQLTEQVTLKKDSFEYGLLVRLSSVIVGNYYA